MAEPVELLASRLIDQGLRAAFGVTGSGRSWALISTLEKRGVRFWPVAHEAAGAIMAGTFAKLSGGLAASISIKGPGLANMFPGIVHNHFENNSAISLSECFGSDVPAHRKHKRLSQAAILGSVVKGILPLNHAQADLARLVELARSEPPGPVHIDLCETTPGGVPPPERIPQASPQEEADFQLAIQWLRRAEKPLVIVGSLALRRPWGRGLAAMRCPILTTASAKGALDERLSHAAGVFTGDGKELAPERRLIERCDLVVGIGLRNTEILTPRPFGRPTILLDEVDLGLGDGLRPDLQMNSSSPSGYLGVMEALAEKDWGLEDVQSTRGTLREELLGGGWLPGQCFEALNELDFEFVLAMDTGSFCTIAEHVYAASPQRRFVGSSNGRYMGVGIPVALGAAIACPDVPALCIVGDGGVRNHLVELKLAAEESLAVCVILMTDGRFGSIASAEQGNTLSQRAVEIRNPSWFRAIQGMGVRAKVVHSCKELTGELRSWDRQSPLFLEAPFDPVAYGSMTSRLR